MAKVTFSVWTRTSTGSVALALQKVAAEPSLGFPAGTTGSQLEANLGRVHEYLGV